MAEMTQGTFHPGEARHYRILIKSVGSAPPATAAALAKGLGLPTATVISRLYRAPAILVDQIDKPTAQQMLALLSEIGYDAELQPTSSAAPDLAPLYDVAIYITEARQLPHAVTTLANFGGLSEADASNLIMSSPGVVLGSVSEATVRAFAEQMGDGVAIVSSQPKTAHYHLFLADGPSLVRTRIIEAITEAGIPTVDDSGLIATDLDHTTAQTLWQRYQASGLLRIVNHDFLRFDLVLQESQGSNDPTPQQLAALEQLAGVPAELTEAVFRSPPITLLEAIPHAEIGERMAAFDAVGLSLRAELITFQNLGLQVLSLSDQAELQRTLEGFGLHQPGSNLPPPPFQIPGVMPELQARILRAALEDAGARIAFAEAA